MKMITRTIYGAIVQTNHLLGLPQRYVANTTLNERFEILKDKIPTNVQVPRMVYWAYGNGGHRFDVGADGTPVPAPIQHRATDAAPYKPLPFVLRLTGEDLTTAERLKYCLRKEIEVEGITYIAYYGYRMNLTGVTAEMQTKVIQDGNIETRPFTPDNSNLFPTPPDLNNTGVNVTEGTYVVATAKVGLSLNRQDTDELLNVAKVLFNDEKYAIISEIALFSGVDENVTVSVPGQGSFVFKDVIGAQVNSHINTLFPMAFSDLGMELTLDIGATEPLLKLV